MKQVSPTITHALVVDLEATCCNRGTLRKEDVEIIEIGAVVIELSSFQTCLDFHDYIRPVKSTTLTSFCRRLTGIQQSDVDRADYFPVVLSRLLTQTSPYPEIIFASWSDFDWRQLKTDCAYHGTAFPFTQHHWDLQRMFRRVQRQKQLHSVSGALASVELEFEGRKHSAADDARNTARLLPFCL